MATAHRKWLWLLLLAGFVSALGGLTYTAQLLSLLTPDHWCWDVNVQALQEQLPLPPQEAKKFSLPPVKQPAGELHPTGFSQCERYDGDLVGAYVGWVSARRPHYRDTGAVKSCDQGWTYNHTAVFPTIPSQLNWVCGAKWKPYAVHVSFWLASAAGVAMWNSVSTRFGRHYTLLVALSTYLLGGLATLLATGFASILASRMLAGVSHLAVRHQALLLAVEADDSGGGVLVLAAMFVTYTMASLGTTWTAMLVTSWWWLTLDAVLPIFVCLLLASWLFLMCPLMSGIDMTASRVNCDVAILEAANQENPEDVKEPEHQPNSYVLNSVWMVSCLCYYAQSQSAPTLASVAAGTRPTDVAVISSCWYAMLMEAPCWGIPLLLPSWRRWWIMAVSLAGTAILGVVPILLPKERSTMGALALLLLTRLAATAAYYTVYQQRIEVSGQHKNRLMTGEVLGGVSVALVPLVISLGEVNPRLPMLVLSTMALLGALASLWLRGIRRDTVDTDASTSSPSCRESKNWLRVFRQAPSSSIFVNDKIGCIAKYEVSTLPYKPLEFT